MKTRNKPRFDVEALRDLAGAKVFARGEAYFEGGQVIILSLGRQRVVAQVTGTEDYSTELTGRGEEIGGECSCRAFEDWGFCKHMVAAALAVNAAGDQAEEEGADALSRIRAHLKGQATDALVDMIVGLAERDVGLFGRLDMAAAITAGDDKAVETRLRKAIDSATLTRSYIGYQEVRRWAAGVNEALGAIADLVPTGRASLTLALANRAIDRIWKATEGIDDSDGHCGALLDRAREIHLAAARVTRPDPVQLGRDLFTREINSDGDTFSGAAELYADVLGEKGLREYRRLASEAWMKLPARSGVAGDEHAFSGDYYRLMGILDFFARRDGDVDARIALRAKDLTSQGGYLQLGEFCLSNGRAEEALRRTEEGLWMFEDRRPDERLLFFVVKLLSKAGRKADAENHLWRAFEKAPSLELFTSLRRLGGEAARDRALMSLATRLVNKGRAHGQLSADLLVCILMQEKMFSAAWATCRTHDVAPELKESLARNSEATHPGEVLATYAERVDQLARGGGQEAYEHAAKLIARMAALRDAAGQAAYVAAIKERHGRKRNFMKLLEKAHAPRRDR